jgi:hypothetical protein
MHARSKSRGLLVLAAIVPTLAASCGAEHGSHGAPA